MRFKTIFFVLLCGVVIACKTSTSTNDGEAASTKSGSDLTNSRVTHAIPLAKQLASKELGDFAVADFNVIQSQTDQKNVVLLAQNGNDENSRYIVRVADKSTPPVAEMVYSSAMYTSSILLMNGVLYRSECGQSSGFDEIYKIQLWSPGMSAYRSGSPGGTVIAKKIIGRSNPPHTCIEEMKLSGDRFSVRRQGQKSFTDFQ